MDRAGVEGGCAEPEPEFEDGGGVLPEGVEGPRELWARRGVVGRLLGPAQFLFRKTSAENKKRKKKEEADAYLQLMNLQLNHRWKLV